MSAFPEDRLADWSEPPEAKKVGPQEGRRRRFVELLKDRPGQWAEYLPPPDKPGWAASSVIVGFRKDYPGTEAVARPFKTPGGRRTLYRVWVRWTG